ncbi:8186_t:CDS:1, partial [Cetraspora pellucida]
EHQAVKTNMSYEESYITIQDDKLEIDELNKIRLQDSTESLHNK